MLEIKPFDKIHMPQSYDFLMDSFTISFGPDKTAWPKDLGTYLFEEYCKDIEKMLSFPANTSFSVWDGTNLIGQIELKKLKVPKSCGYVSFYYLIPEYRHKGLGKQLDDFAVSTLKQKGFARARLTVSELNIAGQKFYKKNGWTALGPDPDRPLGITMEKLLA